MALYGLVLWLAVWAFFLVMRFSRLDVRDIPAAGPILLVSLAYSFLAPLAAGALSLIGSFDSWQPDRSDGPLAGWGLARHGN